MCPAGCGLAGGGWRGGGEEVARTREGWWWMGALSPMEIFKEKRSVYWSGLGVRAERPRCGPKGPLRAAAGGGGDLPQRLSRLELQAPPSWPALQRPGLLPTTVLPPSSALPTSRHSRHENFCLVPLAFCLSHLPLSRLFSGPALGLFARPQHGPWEPWSFVVLTSVSSCRRLLQQYDPIELSVVTEMSCNLCYPM